MEKELFETVDDLQTRLAVIEAHLVDMAAHKPKPRFSSELWILAFGITGLVFGIAAFVVAIVHTIIDR